MYSLPVVFPGRLSLCSLQRFAVLCLPTNVRITLTLYNLKTGDVHSFQGIFLLLSLYFFTYFSYLLVISTNCALTPHLPPLNWIFLFVKVLHTGHWFLKYPCSSYKWSWVLEQRKHLYLKYSSQWQLYSFTMSLECYNIPITSVCLKGLCSVFKI